CNNPTDDNLYPNKEISIMWFLFCRKTRSSKPARRVPPSCRPRLEALEDRCTPSAGMLDPTFGNGAGYVITAPTNGASLQGGELLQPDGKIIETGNGYVVGKNGKVSASDFVAVRYNTDGSLDKSFGTGGIALAASAQNGVNGGFFAVHGLGAA